jgi:hypothetical protein
MSDQTSQLPAVKQHDPFALAVTKKNGGRRLSFISGYPDGGVRQALKAKNPDLKGKALSKAVDEVFRGEKDVRWALLDAQNSYLRSRGGVPVITDINKKGNKFKTEIVLLEQEPLADLTDDQLEAELAKRKAARNGKAEQKPIDVGGKAEIKDEQPATDSKQE